MFAIDDSAVAFPDDRPVVYPDTEVWRELTLRRKKYASIDLASRGPSEERIFKALDENTNLEFIETSLGDVVSYLEDFHHIQIEIDNQALRDVGLDTEVPITRNLRAISLRSALRLMLRELGLTYMVRDEVLLITTPEEVLYRPVIEIYDISQLQPDSDLQHFLTDEMPKMIAPNRDHSPDAYYSVLRDYLIVCDHAEAQREVQRILKILYETDHPGSDER